MLYYFYILLLILYSIFIDIPAKQKVKHGEFPFELVYEYKGVRQTFKDTMFVIMTVIFGV